MPLSQIEKNRRWKQSHPDKVREQGKRWYIRHKGTILLKRKQDYTKKWLKEHPEKNLQYCYKWRAKNPDKLHIKEHFQAWLKVKANHCEVCGTTENLQRHHNDYSKPLEVVILCRKHHRELHQERRQVPTESRLLTT